MQNKQLTISSNNITRCFLLFIVLLTIGIGLYGYNYTNAWLAEKKYALNNISNSLQKRIDSYRYITYQVYDKFGNAPSQNADPSLQETRLRPDVYYVEKPHKKTDAVIFGSHDDNTLAMIANISDYLDNRWGAKTESYAMYYLNGQDNSLSLITTQPLKELASRFRESYLTTSAEDRRAEMLQQANLLDERESFSALRKQRFQNAYSFSIRTTFNQPGHLATVIAFDLPINDIIPVNMARSNFLLQPDDIDLDDGTLPAETTLGAGVAMSGSWVEFSAALPNAPLKVVYRVSAFSLAIDLLRNNIWLIVINLLLLALSMMSIYFVRRQYIRPSENLAAELETERALNQEIIASLPSGLLIYNFASNTVIASNKIAEHLLPHLSLQKIAHMAEQHHGVIQATVNNEVYEIRIFRSQLSPETYLFLLNDQDKEVMVNKRLQQARREYDKNVQARKLMLHNLGIELNQPVRQMHDLADRLRSQPDGEQQQALLNQLTAESSSVLALIENITLLTRLETQDWQPSRQPFNPAALIDELLLEALPAINQKGLALFNHFHLDVEQNYIGDAHALRKVISLLVHYAIITTACGKISLVVDHEPGHPDRLVFHINDTGSGISNEEISNLNYPFLSQTLVDRFNHGSGLTFFLCNQLCKRLNGQLDIRSKVDIGTRYTIRVAMEMEKKEAQEQEKLLDGVTALLDITSEEVRGIVTQQLQAYGASCIVAEDRQINRDYDVLLTDNPQRADDYTLLLATDEAGWQQLEKRYIRVNYNLNGAMLDAVLMLIEQQMAALEQDESPLSLTAEDIQLYEKQLKSSDYYSLFVDTVPDDVKKLYTEAGSSDFNALSQTAHRLKGVFAMLNLLPGKQLCESLEQHIADGDALEIENNISQIDFFVSRLLEQGSQQHE
ncbi:Sensor-like histidine kinase RcsD [Serratia entomophila]|uniref:Phosphotransferase RcsD n=1 Tax=Serratia entomophila TaxID=42906 RepID=A0ABY5CND5_9GAMM|nr:phosphotransferase RcsD [Serratia entomophila]UIW17021.1 phosphotransferase RcsD [Serratia entomophila]USU99576.1 phosphotransferase RcsD [Serratia entomophila]CAI0694363.1 Sensor-like histidine kinase RcsD [Serratia entomophila]CAI0694462.1 Sensor-like histidine kinase RcsD [Serratia entomophila]CAI0695475.1 Sensor-like histidine kinase RcsD [Serratia entomophila]